MLSLPKGGGALHGIGETFSPDLFTGTGNFTVPVTLPPGRNGFQPELNLVYSTGTGNGPFGLGWALSIPGVSRKTSHGIPRYRDADDDEQKRDTFILSGAEDLVPVDENATWTRYRPRTEGLFARITHHHGVSGNYWEVCSKDGLISLYGNPRSPTAGADWQDSAVIADPDKRDKIFAWKLTETRDPFGNRIVYEYERDTGKTDGHSWDQLYLKRIRYVDYTTPNGKTQYLVSVTFDYQELKEHYADSVSAAERIYPFSDYRAGFEIRTRKRCTSIRVATHTDADRQTRTYSLIYLDQRTDLQNLSALLPRNGVSFLSQIKVTGYDGAEAESLPSLDFGYTLFEPAKQDFFPLEGPDLPAESLADPGLELVDLFGNGLPDILEMNGTVRYWRNLGAGRFDLPRPMSEAPAGLSLADTGVQLIDADGDGRIDLLATVDNLFGYFPLGFDGLWDKRSFKRQAIAPSFNLEDPEVRLVDLTGNGVTDAIRSGTRLECFFNDPKNGWQKSHWVERRALKDFPNVQFSDPRVKWGDMSGDGLQDIVLVYDGNVEYWPNLGYGAWGKRIHMHDSPRFPHGYDPSRILIGDVDGDGIADLVYVDDTRITLWINQCGNGWSDPIEILGTPPVSNMDAVRLVDLLGSGIGGVLWSKDAPATGRDHYFFLDLTGGSKPYLLHEMDNRMGAVTRVQYKPSTEFYREDQKRPDRRWKTPLPFAVQVVARVEIIDEISRGKLTTEYGYRHGYWDGAEREFRGFGLVEHYDTERFDVYNQHGLHGDAVGFENFEGSTRDKHFSPPLLTKTWFHQGPIGDEFGEWGETDFSAEFWSGDPQQLPRPAAMTDFLNGLGRRVKRDALRTLRGRILRIEIYALDGSEREDHPYTVTEYLHGVDSLPVDKPWPQPPAKPADWQEKIFFPHGLAQRVTQWERGDDPMTQLGFTEDYDAFGQPRRQTRIACPRGWRDLADTFEEPFLAFLATRTLTEYAGSTDPQRYIHDRVAMTTAYEIVNDGLQAVLALKATPDASNALKVIGQTLSYYDGNAYQGRDYGEVGDYGALVRTETLILTEDILQAAYPEYSPPQLTSAAPAWTAEYPPEYQNLLQPRAGYAFHPAGPGDGHPAGYFAVTGQQYDFHTQPTGRGLPTVTKDALGNETKVEYDSYWLTPTQVTDPAGLKTQADYDYRVLQPKQVTDPNRTRTRYSYTPLGLLETTAVMGRQGENQGDTDQAPGTRFAYDFLTFGQGKQPISVRTIRRVHHINDTDVDLTERDQTIETVEYSDGFGRLLQTRTQAEDITFGDPSFGDANLPHDQSASNWNAVGRLACQGGQPNVVVSGWQTYDNKGRVIEKYEPFFACGWDYAPAIGAEKGQKATMYYDPRGQVIRTVNPDGSEQRVVYGVPTDLADPAHFTPTPWEITTYDENDNAGRTHYNDALGYQHHWNTPSSAVVDALGRTIRSVERNGTTPADAYSTKSSYDIRGNLLTVEDALGRLAFRYVYDLTPRQEGGEDEQGAQVLRIEQLDSGVQRIVMDASGNEIDRRDSKGALTLQSYDALGRPIRLWARDKTGEAVTLRERVIYGDSPDAGLTGNELDAGNLRGALYRHYDEAGLLSFDAYDFKGNVLEKVRRVISDTAILAVFDPPPPNWEVKPFRVDWQPPAGATPEDHATGLLDATLYQSSFAYDALNRVNTMRYPRDVDGERKELHSTYNRAGALEAVTLDGTDYVKHIAYNAKGQRTLIAYGNGVMTRYAYDEQAFRLKRLRSERYSMSAVATYHPKGAALQDFAYDYDLAGNILRIRDRTPDCGIPNTLQGKNALDRVFTYDPIYHLQTATGRECAIPPMQAPWDDAPKCQDVHLTRAYQETYSYDAVGNLNQLNHAAGAGGYVRSYGLAAGNNRLQTMDIGASAYTYQSDVNGNTTGENGSRHFEWDHGDQMRVFRNQVDRSEPSAYAQYFYDTDGQRVKKLVRKQAGAIVSATVYIDEIFENKWRANGVSAQENSTLHLMDFQTRVAMLRVGVPFGSADTSPAVQFQIGDHIGSSNLLCNSNGNWLNREEFTPYGETSFGSFARKCYRFAGRERDNENGLNYHRSRYYAPWLARWLATDPITRLHANGVYNYAGCNPLRYVDPYGNEAEDIAQEVRNLVNQVKRRFAHYLWELDTVQRNFDITKLDARELNKYRRQLGQAVAESVQQDLAEIIGRNTVEVRYSRYGRSRIDISMKKLGVDIELKLSSKAIRSGQRNAFQLHAKELKRILVFLTPEGKPEIFNYRTAPLTVGQLEKIRFVTKQLKGHTDHLIHPVPKAPARAGASPKSAGFARIGVILGIAGGALVAHQLLTARTNAEKDEAELSALEFFIATINPSAGFLFTLSTRAIDCNVH